MHINNKKTLSSMFKIFSFLISFLILVVVYSFSIDKEYGPITLLPLTYIICYYFFRALSKRTFQNNRDYGLIYKSSLLVIYIRYMLTPLSIVLTGKYDYAKVFISKESSNMAVHLMIFELIGVFVVLYLSRLHYYKKPTNDQTTNLLNNNNDILILFVISSLLIIVLVDYRILIPDNFILIGNDYSHLGGQSSKSGLITILLSMIKPVIFLLCFSKISKQTKSKKKNSHIVILFLILLIFMASYTGSQRWEIVFAAITGLYLTHRIYGSIPRTVSFGIIGVMIVSFISISIYKFSWSIDSNPIIDVTIEMFSMLQDYFSGPRSVAASLEMNKNYGSSLTYVTFLNDFFGSVPFISQYIDQSNRTNVFFNLFHYLDNKSLIIPMIGIGYIYFPFFPSIITVICYWFVSKLDSLLLKTNFIEFQYIYLYFGLYLSMSMGFNTQIVFGKFLTPFLTLYILFVTNRKMVFKRGR